MAETHEDSAADRTAHFLKRAVAAIDAEFGEGYAAANPALVGSFLQSASIESAILSADAALETTLGTVLPHADKSIERVCASLEYLKPRLFG